MKAGRGSLCAEIQFVTSLSRSNRALGWELTASAQTVAGFRNFWNFLNIRIGKLLLMALIILGSRHEGAWRQWRFKYLNRT
jgi:hypothetical protein